MTNKHSINTQISVPLVGGKPTTPPFDRAKAVYGSELAVNATHIAGVIELN
jgi:hypothetical protein